MKQDNDLKVIKPFGPSIARAKMPEDLIINLNNYIEETNSPDWFGYMRID